MLCILGVSHLNAQQTVFTGSCGAAANDNLTWTLNTESNTLTISGAGAMTDYDNANNKAPWMAYNDDDLVYLKLEEGLTHIGDYAFYNRTYLEELRILTTVTSIGDYAFGRCLSVTSVMALPETPPNSKVTLSAMSEQHYSTTTKITLMTKICGLRISPKDTLSLSIKSATTYYPS